MRVCRVTVVIVQINEQKQPLSEKQTFSFFIYMYSKIHPVCDTCICVVFASLADCAFKQREYGLLLTRSTLGCFSVSYWGRNEPLRELNLSVPGRGIELCVRRILTFNICVNAMKLGGFSKLNLARI